MLTGLLILCTLLLTVAAFMAGGWAASRDELPDTDADDVLALECDALAAQIAAFRKLVEVDVMAHLQGLREAMPRKRRRAQKPAEVAT